jgi:enoyl-CoA hydratase/carnithine racemase
LEVILYGYFMEMINIMDFEKEAQHKLTQSIYDFIAGGAGDEYTLNRNIEAFKHIHLVPQIFRSSNDTNTTITLLNHQLSHPFMVAPSAFHSSVHPQGEIATIRAVNQMGLGMILSTMSSIPLETVAKEATCPLWFQLYLFKDRSITRQLIQQVTAAGYTALVLTIDVPIMGNRERDKRNRFKWQVSFTAPKINAVVVYGGKNRSFSVGGDFNEVKLLSGGEDVEQWIDRIINLYLTALNVKKPTIACLDGFVIGIGFQLAMMFDWRIIADTGVLIMPELKHGIGCTIGAAILSNVCGYNAMKEIIYGCEPVSPERALAYQLVNEIHPSEHALEQAVLCARKMSAYAQVSFQHTKRAINKPMVKVLLRTAEESKNTHKACFAKKSAEKHFIKVLGEKY